MVGAIALQGKNETKITIVNRPHDTREGIVLVRDWLNSGKMDVKQFDSHLSDGRKAPPQNLPQQDSYRSIAKFLSKNDKAVSYQTVANYLVESPM